LYHTVALLMVGFEGIAIGIAPSPSRSSRLTNIGFGALVVAFGIDVMSFPIHTTQFLTLLSALALLFNGIARIVQGIIDKDMSRWSRDFLVGVGAMSIAVSALVVIHLLTIGVTLLALCISIALLINGIQIIVVGLGVSNDTQNHGLVNELNIFALAIRDRRIQTCTHATY
jgi:uncharacterized membrane protein HdeD (DUF308 family)